MHDQGPRKVDALAHAAGKLARIGRLETMQPDQLDRGDTARAAFSLGDPDRFEPQ